MADTYDFKPTSIDRSNASRVVPMKVLVLGMSRTGTLSIRAALKRLGYVDVYHGFDVMFGNTKDVALWGTAFDAKFEGKGKPFSREDWDKLLGHCQAVTDMPCNLFAEELVKAYPNAKVILNVRDVNEWHKSVVKAINPDGQRAIWASKKGFFNLWPARQYYRDVLVRMLTYSFGDDFQDKGKQRYHDHNKNIRALVPQEKLLEYEVSSGWEPLCKFLNEAIPDEPFPTGNEAVITRGRLARSGMRDKLLALSQWAVAGAGALGLLYLAGTTVRKFLS